MLAFGTAPRMRGDDPTLFFQRIGTPTCSPHARGWSRELSGTRHVQVLLPACAGMIPVKQSSLLAVMTAPRMRGDDPLCWPMRCRESVCSPHARG